MNDDRPVLVPLDGSVLAERALPWAVMLATRWRAPLVLVRVVELRIHGAVSLAEVALAAGGLEGALAESLAYLQGKAEALRVDHPGLAVRLESTSGEPVHTLLEIEKTSDARLVVLSTHGRTGLSRLARGSVAETIVCHGAAPVLLVRPWDRVESEVELMRKAHDGLRILVPLDGSPLAQGILPLVTELASGAGGTLILAGIVRPADEHAIGPYYQPQRVPETRHALREYLDHRRDAVRATGVEATSVVGMERDVAGALVDFASIESADMIALSTHGRGAVGRLLYGSVADRVAHDARVPVLLFRPQAAAQRPPHETHELVEALSVAG